MAASMSYYHKPRTNPVDYRTIHQILDDNTAKHPDKECIVFYDVNEHRSCLTYQQLKDQSIKFAASLLKLGFKRGDRILLYAPNSLELMVCWMAMTRLGVCAVLLYFSDTKWELFELFKRIKCHGLIVGLTNVSEEQRQRIVGEIGEITEQKNEHGQAYAKVIITIGDSKTNIKHPNILQYENLMDTVSSDQPDVKLAERKIDAEDRALACFTSGTTSGSTDSRKLKCVSYTHRAVVNSYTKRNNSDTRNTYFLPKPIAWGSGFNTFIMSLINCATCVFTLYKRMTIQDSYKLMFDIIQAENINLARIPPQHIHQLISEKFHEKYDFSNLSGWGFGSQIVHRTIIQALLDKLPHTKAFLLYASCETSGIAMQPLCQETVRIKEDYGKMYMFPDIEVKIIDDEGQVVPLGTKGEICVRGPKMFHEYLEDPAATSNAKKPTGWVHTGDYGIMYDRARIKVLGRQIDLIATKDQALFPVEVEEVLLENPDVQDLVVVGVPNKDQKDDVCACIIEVPGSNLEARVDELSEWCKTTFSENKMELMPMLIVFLKSFPISKGGKVNRLAIEGLAKESHKYVVN